MSWQSYVDDQLVGSGQLASAAIVNLSEATVSARSSSFPEITDEEISAIIDGYKSPNSFYDNGFTIGGTAYMAVKADERSVYGKKEATGVCMAKTSQLLIIGVYDEKNQPSSAALVVEKLADFFIENGY
ncbi:hypothetical protein Syun_011413 [Stephania yunnanensis]|uniref:Profilin n=1 Tax=Stephania yunnanensis TaxID=152371 RepID=A0AAP0PED1_9MAGN